MTKPVWCVAWKKTWKKPAEVYWCATKRGKSPSKDAVHDETRCGYVVHFRVGSARMIPTCPDCRKAMKLPAIVTLSAS